MVCVTPPPASFVNGSLVSWIYYLVRKAKRGVEGLNFEIVLLVFAAQI